MLKLIIAEGSPPALPEGGDLTVDVWRDHDGAACAYGYRRGRDHWMHVPDVAAFRFAARDIEVTALMDRSARRELVIDAFYRAVLPMALQARGREVLHSSGVLGPTGVIALCAVSETGKSTIACGLSRRGHRLWADDAVTLDTDDDPVTAIPLPFSLRLRPESAAFFQQNGGSPTSITPRFAEERTAPLAAVCVLERDAQADPVEIERLSPADAFPAVLTHGYCFSLEDADRRAEMMRHYLDLVARTPVFRVRLCDGLEHLGDILDAIEQAAGMA